MKIYQLRFNEIMHILPIMAPLKIIYLSSLCLLFQSFTPCRWIPQQLISWTARIPNSRINNTHSIFKKMPSQMDVALWGYKWTWLDGVQVGWDKRHLTVLMTITFWSLVNNPNMLLELVVSWNSMQDIQKLDITSLWLFTLSWVLLVLLDTGW